MADYKFDGKNLRHRNTTIANVSGDKIRKGTGGTTVANIKGDKICERTGGNTLANVKGSDIRHGTGGSRIATMKDVDNAIDGPGGVTKAALWYMFVR